MIVLDESHLRAVLTMPEVITAVEDGFRAVARGAAKSPERLRLDVESQSAVVLEMPASIEDPEQSSPASALGTKIVSVFPNNKSLGLEIVQATYVLLDPLTGATLAVMDGRFVTGIRTAATSAVATRFMASPGSKTLVVFGCGVQARFHVEAMRCVADIERILLVCRSVDAGRELAAELRNRFGVDCEIAPAKEAVPAASLICTCTTSAEPLFDGDLLRPGAHINAVGAFTPSSRELDTRAVLRSRVVVDEMSAAGREAGEILIPLADQAIGPDHVKATLAEIVAGPKPGRTSADEITLFKSCGLAVEDLVTARLAYVKARAMGIGTEVSI